MATATQPTTTAEFGTAQDAATFSGPPAKVNAQVAALASRFGRVDAIENQSLAIPGSVLTFALRAQDPHGAFGQPLLALVSGRYPSGPGEVAVTSGVARDLHLSVGGTWTTSGISRDVTGIVENPQNLLDEFALVAPGQVTSPDQVTVLFNAGRVDPGRIGPTVTDVAQAANGNVLNPETISLTAATLACCSSR